VIPEAPIPFSMAALNAGNAGIAGILGLASFERP